MKTLRGLITAGIWASTVYIIGDYLYYSRPPSAEKKEAFQAELKDFSKTLERKFPKEAKTENVIDLTIMVDADFKRNHDSWLSPFDNDDWEEELNIGLEIAAQRFYEEFKIAFNVKHLQYWDPEIIDPIPMLGFLMQVEDSTNETIGIIGITGKHIVDPSGGYATVIGQEDINLISVVRDIRDPVIPEAMIYKDIPLENLLQHEISHWFDAVDSEGMVDSIMDYETVTDTITWDEKNKTRMNETLPELLEYIKLQKDLKTKQQ